MTTNAMIERDATASEARSSEAGSSQATASDASTDAFVEFLRSEFPAWSFDLERTESWGGETRPLWLATKPEHHPQSALTAGKLHRRLCDYEARIAARHPEGN
jgi:hypothetical protein